MPSRKRPDGQHQDLAHPINDQTRKYLTEKVMCEYERELRNPSPQSIPETSAPSSTY
jgi:DNA-binding cell septation regulator SpoVG